MTNVGQAEHLVPNGCIAHCLIELGNGLRGRLGRFLLPLYAEGHAIHQALCSKSPTSTCLLSESISVGLEARSSA